ncbi:hypothetical protein [Motilimonas pumila]|uniref:Uncharacterized protein n=1 Tax=Motilimonas pumila TaxID=2303987 RepID=A0A418Y9F1_9GAMM|nr:hypothetical protein [Motilimonas pumila]RJG37252.1 hypothetical protein D1Z90_19895 [Motilimonas pumila]
MSQRAFDGEKPQVMIEFLDRFGTKGQLPAAFLTQEGEFLLSIQYLFEDCWSKNFDQANSLLRFGVNTDGWDLLVDIGDEQLVILQDEMGDIDSIDISVFDLLEANVEQA